MTLVGFESTALSFRTSSTPRRRTYPIICLPPDQVVTQHTFLTNISLSIRQQWQKPVHGQTHNSHRRRVPYIGTERAANDRGDDAHVQLTNTICCCPHVSIVVVAISFSLLTTTVATEEEACLQGRRIQLVL